MPTFNLSSLQAGDIVLFQWLGSGWHTTLCVGQGQIAHCVNEQQGTLIDAMTNHTANAQNIYGFRAAGGKANVMARAVTIARGWVTGGNAPGYSTARGGAVMSRFGFDSRNGAEGPPFGYDALYRVLKWTQRTQGKFSKNRGTTCCAFVMATFQTAAMIDFFNDSQQTLQACFNHLGQHRSTRGETRRLQLSPKDRARIEVSNVGPDNKYLKGHEEKNIETIWKQMLGAIHYYGGDGQSLQDIFTPAMFCDAKFTFSNTLYKRLQAAQGWNPVPIPKSP